MALAFVAHDDEAESHSHVALRALHSLAAVSAEHGPNWHEFDDVIHWQLFHALHSVDVVRDPHGFLRQVESPHSQFSFATQRFWPSSSQLALVDVGAGGVGVDTGCGVVVGLVVGGDCVEAGRGVFTAEVVTGLSVGISNGAKVEGLSCGAGVVGNGAGVVSHGLAVVGEPNGEDVVGTVGGEKVLSGGEKVLPGGENVNGLGDDDDDEDGPGVDGALEYNESHHDIAVDQTQSQRWLHPFWTYSHEHGGAELVLPGS